MSRTEQQVTVTITKVFYEGEFSHWEAECEYPEHGGKAGTSVTGPSVWAVMDGVTQYWWDAEWFADNSNVEVR